MKRIRVKPGKGQSTAGFIGGLLFVLLGFFVVIPTFGAFGLVWTLVAAVICGVNAVNAFSDKGVASHEIIIDEDEGRLSGQLSEPRGDPAERLEKLRELYERHLITEAEYQQRRAEILNEL